ncbi:NAD-binding protein [Gilvimarinus sp. F26214L]|uniref:NAD-binding protein n=1 Tax=Gilvimarinus sp. DZF01 TaxID=3461371 RepID=UPI004045DFA1
MESAASQKAAAPQHQLGLSKELGGLLAGISLASTPFREAIIARLAPLRDFLLLFFFIALGTQLDLGLLGAQVGPALLLSVFVLIGNPLIVMIIMGAMGYRKRTGFLAGLTVAQISEFSLIFVSMGLTLGHLQTEALGLVTLVGLITIALSVYMITYSHHLYQWLEPALGLFERRVAYREEAIDDFAAPDSHHDLVLIGLGRYGTAIAKHFYEENLRILAVDFDPDKVRRWRQQGYDAVYGDASDPEFIESLNLSKVRWVISALPQHDLGLTREDSRESLIDGLRIHGYGGKIAVSSHNPDDVQHLLAKGADLVLSPFTDAAELAVERIRSSMRNAA